MEMQLPAWPTLTYGNILVTVLTSLPISFSNQRKPQTTEDNSLVQTVLLVHPAGWYRSPVIIMKCEQCKLDRVQHESNLSVQVFRICLAAEIHIQIHSSANALSSKCMNKISIITYVYQLAVWLTTRQQIYFLSSFFTPQLPSVNEIKYWTFSSHQLKRSHVCWSLQTAVLQHSAQYLKEINSQQSARCLITIPQT